MDTRFFYATTIGQNLPEQDVWFDVPGDLDDFIFFWDDDEGPSQK